MKYLITKIKAPFIILTSLIISLQISFLSNCYGQNFILKNELKRDAISFIKVKNLIVIPIFINGKGPFNFILDTGVSPLIVTDPSLISNFSTEGLRPFKINGAGDGAEIDVLLVNNVQVDLGEAYIDNIPTVVLKEEIFNFSNYLGIKVHGIIGYHFFKSFLVKINYQTNRLVFELPGLNKKIKGTKINIEFFENKPYINAKLSTDNLGEINALLIVDNGASHALSLETYQGSAFPVPTQNIDGNLGVGLSGEINGKIGRVKSLKIGNYHINNLLTNFPNYNDIAAKTNVKNRTGNIGAEVLKRFHVTFDYQNNAMYLKKNNSFKELFEHDMSGLEIYSNSSDENRFFINRVEVGSPGEKAGFELGDELISINFKDIRFSSLDDITSLLKSIDGQTILFEIVRKNNILVKLLRLKRRV